MSIKNLLPVWNKKNALVRRSNIDHPFLTMQEEMNRLFDQFFMGFPALHFQKQFTDSFPRIDMRETGDKIIIEAEMPGMDEKDIQISLNHNVLTIHGQKQEKREKNEKVYYLERTYGFFHRSIPLHSEVDEKHVEAKFKRGVLRITLPKLPDSEQKTKSIPIRIS